MRKKTIAQLVRKMYQEADMEYRVCLLNIGKYGNDLEKWPKNEREQVHVLAGKREAFRDVLKEIG